MPVRLDAAGTGHRPWTAPTRPWSLAMRWHDLAFLHRPVRPALLRPHLPRGLELDTFDGSAWLGSVPFRMSGVRVHGLPALPGLSAFPEINLRTYATAGGRPGVWFFSLDVTSRVAVAVARAWFHLPYHRARMALCGEDGRVAYEHERVRDARVGFRGRYRGVGEPFRAAPGSLEAFLVERYCLYATDRRGRLLRGDVHHAPWTLQRAECEVARDTLAAPLGLSEFGGEPLAHFARELDVVAWSLRPVEVG
ncbi:MAG TPA: DUF2071 domain-containing protein [Planctomycetota bacterium]|nr:DUF2071 domain-containing protein [Planctomycetota bacterium]